MKPSVTLLISLLLLAGPYTKAFPSASLQASDPQAGTFKPSQETVHFGQATIWNCYFQYGLTVQHEGPVSMVRITSTEGYQIATVYSDASFGDTLEMPVDSVSGSFRLDIRHCPASMDQGQGLITINAEGYDTSYINLYSDIIHQDPYLWTSSDTINFGGVVVGACAEFWPSLDLGVKGPESLLRITGSKGYEFAMGYLGYEYDDTLEVPIQNGDYFNLDIRHCPTTVDETPGMIILSAAGYATLYIPAFSDIMEQGYTVTLGANPLEALDIMTGEGTYAKGDTVRIFAATHPAAEPGPNEWFFYNWTEEDTVVFQQCGYSDFRFVIDKDRHFVANFVPDVPLFRFPEPSDFGVVPVGECKILRYGVGSEYCTSLPQPGPDPVSRADPLEMENIMIIANEGFQVKLHDFPFSDTTYLGFSGNFAFGESLYVKFCPTEEKVYQDSILHLYPGSEPGLYPVTGTGIAFPVLELTMILEGPYTPGEEFPMERKTPLNNEHLFYRTPPGNPSPMWFFEQQIFLDDNFNFGFPQEQRDDIIDWVLVELYDAASPEEIIPQSLLERSPYLLMKDGRILDTYGRPPTVSHPVTQNLYVIVYHLNHLGVISPGLQEQDNEYVFDFTRSASGSFHGQKHLGDGIYGAFAGDADGNGIIELRDRSHVIDPYMGMEYRWPADFNLDGVVTEADLKLWEDNMEQPSEVPVTLNTNTDGMPCSGYETITDARDGRIYHSVQIGNQCWLTENAAYLPEITSSAAFPDNQPAYYVYDYHGNDLQQATASEAYQGYGTLYNWMAALDACPAGWHLPEEADWAQLAAYLLERYTVSDEAGNPRSLGNVLKSCRQQQTPLGEGCNTQEHPRWDQNPDFGMDDFRFAALPGGRLVPDTNATLLGTTAYWWSSTQPSDQQAPYTTLQGHTLSHDPGQEAPKTTALSVRCIKEMEASAALYSLDIIVHPEQGGTIGGTGDYPADRTVLLKAQPAEGYDFVHWTQGEEVISPEPYLVYQMPDADVTLEAWFAQPTSIPAAGSLQVNIYPVPAQQLVWVEFDNSGETTLTLFNIHGQAMEQQIVTFAGPTRIAFRVEQMARGIYLLSVKGQKTTEVYRVVLD